MSVFDKIISAGIGNVLEGAGNFAKDVRAAITVDMTQEQKAALEQRAKDLESQALEAKSKMAEMQKDVIVAEAKGESWLQRNWRPLTMIMFVVFIGAHLAGYTAPNLSDELVKILFETVKIGIGGYIVGRSAEKGIKHWKSKGD